MQSASNEKFRSIAEAPVDPVFGVASKFKACTAENKVNMGVGAYRTDAGKPYIFNSVKEAEARIIADQTLDKEYLPIGGLPKFNTTSGQLLFGPQFSDRVTTIQCLSGTGSLRVGAEFLAEHGPGVVFISNPTWPNHNNIFQRAGMKIKSYPYWNASTRGINWEGLKAAFDKAAPGDIILLHACAHNPTGCDPTQQQWQELADLVVAKKLYPFFDIAYQGFASGDIDNDAYAIRLFAERGISFLVAQSFAKNIGLYGERIGALHAYCENAEIAGRVNGQLQQVARASYSNPPMHGALIVATVLGDAQLRQKWIDELKEVANRIIAMRVALKDELDKLNTGRDWSHITSQIGMFSYTGLTEAQVGVMEKCNCFLMKSGRISMAGLNTGNVKYVAECMAKAVKEA